MNDLRDMSKMTDTERQVESAVEAQRRSKNCLVDIENVLRRWNCRIEPIMTISFQGIQTSFVVVPQVQVKIQ
jgi:hypothetical protein